MKAATSDVPITKRQAAILKFIEEGYLNGQTPTIREICVEFGISSPNGAETHLKALVKKGAITRIRNSSRAIFPTRFASGVGRVKAMYERLTHRERALVAQWINDSES